MTKSELMNLIIGLPYGETNYKVILKNGSMGTIDHCIYLNNPAYFEIDTRDWGYIYCTDYKEDLTNKVDNRFDIVKVIKSDDSKIINYEELINKISEIKRSIINLQDSVIYDDKLWNCLEEANDKLRECKEYINNKIFEPI